MDFLWQQKCSEEREKLFFIHQIQALEKTKEVIFSDVDSLLLFPVSYLCKRVRLITRLLGLLEKKIIIEEDYKNLSNALNIDIIFCLTERDPQENDSW
jgi:hypothetical protein